VVHAGGDFGRRVAERLRHRATLLASLQHPNIVGLVEIGDASGHGFYCAVEQIEGESLGEMIRSRGPLPHAEVVQILRRVAAALDFAHARGVVHGNLHPKHILQDQTGHIFLIGFGDVAPESSEVKWLGNPHFLAPEQFADFGHIVPETDIYQLSELAFLLLTGSFPFGGTGGSGIGQLLKVKRTGPVPSIRPYRPDLPRSVDSVLKRAMGLQPKARFASANLFVEELTDALARHEKKRGQWWQFWR